jgi:hypothetical protein
MSATRQQHGWLAAGLVREGSDQQAAEWPGEEADAEHRDRRQKTGRLVLDGEEGLADINGEEGVDHEVVEFERVAGNSGGDSHLCDDRLLVAGSRLFEVEARHDGCGRRDVRAHGISVGSVRLEQNPSRLQGSRISIAAAGFLASQLGRY